MIIEVTIEQEDIERYLEGWFESPHNLKVISEVKPIKVIVELQ